VNQPAERTTGERRFGPGDLVGAAGSPEIGGSAYETYLVVRDQIRRMGHGSLTADDIDEAAAAGLFDAPRSVVTALRRHYRTPGEADPARYQPAGPALRDAVQGRLRWLRALAGASLVIPDQPVLGGFGIELDGALYNADSLAASESLIALHFAEILSHLWRAGRRAVVWDVSPGSGVFAYQVKSVCPEITCVLSGSPESLLRSAVYLLTVFPGARALFLAERGDSVALPDWEQADFVFLPEGAFPRFESGRLDLLVDFDPLRRAPAESARPYPRRAFELECPFVYSAWRGDAQPADVEQARRVIEEWYWPHEILLEAQPPRQSAGRVHETLLNGADAAGSSHELATLRHLVGWRRVLV
jgi:hypothetical protein